MYIVRKNKGGRISPLISRCSGKHHLEAKERQNRQGTGEIKEYERAMLINVQPDTIPLLLLIICLNGWRKNYPRKIQLTVKIDNCSRQL